ncbi:MAG: LysM peptidoglycan-binding domain-containing protein [Rhodobacteraceae bacterium]|nr:LysM peptidoglycan-binding domain-containing protein [Paracoccaceae bacterium]
MAGTAGGGGLGALGWSAVVAGVAIAGGAILYVSGALDSNAPEQANQAPQEQIAEPEAAPEKAATPTETEAPVVVQEPAPEPEALPTEDVAEAEPEPEVVATEEAEEEPAAPEKLAEEAEPEVAVAEEDTPKEETPKVDPAAQSATVPENTETATVTPETESVEAEPKVEEEAAAAPAVDPAPEAGEAAALAAPSFDVVRVEPDGTTVIAGSGTEGSRVNVLMDGVMQDSFDVSPGGQFVSFLSLGVSDTARVLTLQAVLGGESVQSEDSIIIAPIEQAEPEPEPEQVATAVEDPAVEDATPEADADLAAPKAQEAVAESSNTVSEPAQTATQTAEVESDPAEEPAESEAAPVAEEQVAINEQPTKPTDTTQANSSEASEEPVTEVEPVQTASLETEPEPKPVVVLRAGSDGVELIQPVPPTESAVQGKVSLDTISYTETGDVRLAGRASAQATVRIYLNNASVTDFPVSGEGRWSGDLTQVEPGVYTLRLDELDEGGQVLSRLETPFKREAPELLRPAVEPEPEAVVQSTAAVTETSDEPVPATPDTPTIRAITVQKGDTLWAISQDRYGEGLLYVKVFDANRSAIRDPDLIYPGQIFTLPE